MNTVKVMGGLGNQMFQYAFSKKVGNALLDISFYDSPDNHTDIIPTREFLLDKFKCNYEIAYKPCFLFVVPEDKYDENRCYDHTFFDGYWQNPRLFSAYKYELRKEFQLKEEYVTDEMKQIVAEMEECESVAVHVRRTDYVTLGYSCDKEYYKQAIKEMRKCVDKPIFYVFSDDIEWCKENFHGCRFVHFKDYQDLYVMSNAKHIIMSNSTFSFWAQYLGRTKKTLLMPKDWNGVPCMFDYRGIVVENIF